LDGSSLILVKSPSWLAAGYLRLNKQMHAAKAIRARFIRGLFETKEYKTEEREKTQE
jgi:hypothetical protein